MAQILSLVTFSVLRWKTLQTAKTRLDKTGGKESRREGSKIMESLEISVKSLTQWMECLWQHALGVLGQEATWVLCFGRSWLRGLGAESWIHKGTTQICSYEWPWRVGGWYFSRNRIYNLRKLIYNNKKRQSWEAEKNHLEDYFNSSELSAMTLIEKE